MVDLCVVYGALRSGTTLFRLMLHAHPRIACPGETDFLFDHLTRGPDGDWRYDRTALVTGRSMRHSMTHLRYPEGKDGREAALDMIAQLRGEAPGPLVLMCHRNLARILDLFPECPVIHMTRDPRDVARSAIGMGWAGNVYYGADIWLATEREWEREAARIPPGRVTDLRYEDLIREPKQTLSRVCAAIGEEFDPAMLSYDAGTTYEAPDASLIEQWRRKLTPREIGLVEHRVGGLLRACGYEPSGHPPVRPGRLARLGLWLGNKRGVWRTRAARYGAVDPLLVAVCRRLSLKGVARAAQRRIDDRAVKYLK